MTSNEASSPFEARRFKFKVVLLGEGAVGKSSLIVRYVENKYTNKRVSTFEASFQKKSIELDNASVDFEIWDTAGQERFHALGPIYYRGSNGVLLIYDITDQRSFDRVKMWVRELETILGTDVSLMIVGNKLDLEKSRTVDRTSAERFATSVGAQYAETSAKENLGISQIFEQLAARMVQRVRNAERDAPLASRSRRTIELVDDDELQQPRSKCC